MVYPPYHTTMGYIFSMNTFRWDMACISGSCPVFFEDRHDFQRRHGNTYVRSQIF